jgi:hypothetical protein
MNSGIFTFNNTTYRQGNKYCCLVIASPKGVAIPNAFEIVLSPPPADSSQSHFI